VDYVGYTSNKLKVGGQLVDNWWTIGGQ